MTEHAFDIETKTDFKTLRLAGLMTDTGTMTFCQYRETTRGVYELLWADVQSDDLLYTWNGEGFDYPCLNIAVKAMEAKGMKLIDGYLISKMLYPDRYSHSLASWLKDLGGEEDQKLTVDYDNAPIEELKDYLNRDLAGTLMVCRHLWGEWNEICKKTGGDAYRILRMEQGIRRLVNVSRDRGFRLHIPKAMSLEFDLVQAMDAAELDAAPHLPKYMLPPSKLDNPPKQQMNGDGSLSKHMQNWLARNGIDDWMHEHGSKTIRYGAGRATLTIPVLKPLVTTQQLSLSNQKEIKEWLRSSGWIPTMWNKGKDGSRTSPMLFDKVTGDVCPNLSRVCPPVLTDAIRNYSVAKSRLGTVQGWLKRQTGGILHADSDTCGTPTARFKHRNIVNVPRVSSAWGERMRALFGPIDTGNVQIGWDASSLEAVMEAHYVHPFDKDYANELVSGDVHQRNMDRLGFPDRDIAKRFKYAVTYGAKPATLARTLSVSEPTAIMWYEEFWSANHGLKALNDYLVKFWKSTGKKYIIGIDRRPLFVRHEHAILNTLLQGSGAILMKYAYLIAAKRISDFSDKCYPLIRYHDEEQWEGPEDQAEHVGMLGVASIEDAGKALDLRVPITGEYKVGANWAECH
jgi:hypothetical protein